MKDFKKEIADYVEWSKKLIESLNQQSLDLTIKMGTLIEDIFVPSIDTVLQQYFNTVPNMIDTKKVVHKGEKTLYLDILAHDDPARTAYVFNVTVCADDIEFAEYFLKKFFSIPTFIPGLADYTLIGLYSCLSITQEIVTFLTRNNLYALVYRGDFLEIPNYQEVNQNLFMGGRADEKK